MTATRTIDWGAYDARLKAQATARWTGWLSRTELHNVMRLWGIRIPVTVRRLPLEPGTVALHWFTEGQHFIDIAPHLSVRQASAALLHELAHCAQSEKFGSRREWRAAYEADEAGYELEALMAESERFSIALPDRRSDALFAPEPKRRNAADSLSTPMLDTSLTVRHAAPVARPPEPTPAPADTRLLEALLERLADRLAEQPVPVVYIEPPVNLLEAPIIEMAPTEVTVQPAEVTVTPQITVQPSSPEVVVMPAEKPRKTTVLRDKRTGRITGTETS